MRVTLFNGLQYTYIPHQTIASIFSAARRQSQFETEEQAIAIREAILANQDDALPKDNNAHKPTEVEEGEDKGDSSNSSSSTEELYSCATTECYHDCLENPDDISIPEGDCVGGEK